jgi:hypothetical protein
LKTRLLKTVNALFAILAVVGGLGATSAIAQNELIFIANYDAKLYVGDNRGEIQMQAKVRNGSTFPVDFQDYRLDVTVSELADGQYRAILNIFERVDGEWYRVNNNDISFDGAYSIPVEYKWNVGDMTLELAISVAIAP